MINLTILWKLYLQLIVLMVLLALGVINRNSGDIYFLIHSLKNILNTEWKNCVNILDKPVNFVLKGDIFLTPAPLFLTYTNTI